MNKTVLGALLILLLCSCVSEQPPRRPLAYMVPTLVPHREIESCIPVELSVQDLVQLLKKAHLYSALRMANLQFSELEILSRGLARRGYAEIDARRASGPIRCISIAHRSELCVHTYFKQIPPAECRFDIPLKLGKQHYENFTLIGTLQEDGTRWESLFLVPVK